MGGQTQPAPITVLLLVDDNPMFREIAGGLLTTRGLKMTDT